MFGCPVDWMLLGQVLDEAKRWLETEQPDGAILSHHGVGTYVGGGVRISFAPLAPGNTVVVVEHSSWRPIHDGHPPARVINPPFTGDISQRLYNLIAETWPVIEDWNRGSLTTFSVRVKAGSPAAKATRNYHECRVHGNGSCVFRSCYEFKTGLGLLIFPSFPKYVDPSDI